MDPQLVIAGQPGPCEARPGCKLDPAIHPFEETRLSMDARVKPAHDDAKTS
ncbi:MAG: hypothetical protein OJF62_002723 [Pseudolabrys sp.]|jgi:hypothetical protein|nr:hypothetical protein [Pseudolabrys sp.]